MLDSPRYIFITFHPYSLLIAFSFLNFILASTGVQLKTPMLQLKDISTLVIDPRNPVGGLPKPPNRAPETYVPRRRSNDYREEYADLRSDRYGERKSSRSRSGSRSPSRFHSPSRFRSYQNAHPDYRGYRGYDYSDHYDYHRQYDRRSRSHTRSRSPMSFSLPAATAAMKTSGEMGINIDDWKKALSQFLVTMGKRLPNQQ